MVSQIDFTDGLVGVLRRIPQLVDHLGDAERIYGYYDLQPDENSVESAKYSQPPGSVLALWVNGIMSDRQGGMRQFLHTSQILVRAASGMSSYTLVHDITNGVPDPGDGQRWYVCPFVAGTYGSEITRVERVTDPEDIDLMVIEIETYEVGDP